MSRENVEMVVGRFERFNAGDFDAIVDAWTEDVTLAARGKLMGLVGVSARQVVAGKESVGGWFADWLGQFASDYRFEVEESRDLDDRVLVVVTQRGRGRASGASVTIQAGYVYTVRGGKISQIEVWDDRQGALEAVGLRE